jgi:hypothetical protein
MVHTHATEEQVTSAVTSRNSRRGVESCVLCGSILVLFDSSYRVQFNYDLTTYACLAWELVALDILKLQRLQNKVLCTIGNFPRCTLVRDLHATFNLPYVYDYIKKLRRQEVQVI